MRQILFLLCLILLAEPGSAEERVWRLGVLTPFDWPADTTMHSVMIPELARRGFVEGKNLVVLPRWVATSVCSRKTSPPPNPT